jgi:hypothetical protein
MRRQSENKNWPEDTPDRNSDPNRRKKGSPGKDTSGTAAPESSDTLPQASQHATRKKKLEDLNDREDLSERKLNDRNWQ